MSEIFHPETIVLNEILINAKPMVIKKGLGYINKDKTPFSKETVFVKSKDETPNQVASLKNPSL